MDNEHVISKPIERNIFLLETYVAGTGYIEGMEELEPYLNVDDKLGLFREPDNQYDYRAIVIKNVDGVKIGYVPMMDNIIFARLMDAGKILSASIVSKKMEENWLKIGIKIYMHE